MEPAPNPVQMFPAEFFPERVASRFLDGKEISSEFTGSIPAKVRESDPKTTTGRVRMVFTAPAFTVDELRAVAWSALDLFVSEERRGRAEKTGAFELTTAEATKHLANTLTRMVPVESKLDPVAVAAAVVMSSLAERRLEGPTWVIAPAHGLLRVEYHPANAARLAPRERAKRV